MNIPNINITTITQSIAIIPEVVRHSLGFAQWDFGQMIARINGVEEADDCGHDHSMDQPLMPWQAGRLALEIVMLIRGHKEFPEGHHDAMNEAVDDIDTPQHAVDVIMALGSMLAHVLDEEQIAMFGKSLTDAEAKAS